MNRRQKIVLWAGIGVFILIGLFPPWVCTTYASAGSLSVFKQQPAGYALLFLGPKNQVGKFQSTQIDIVRLLIQWAIIAVIDGAAIFTLKDKSI